jgi:hypothetical protein
MMIGRPCVSCHQWCSQSRDSFGRQPEMQTRLSRAPPASEPGRGVWLIVRASRLGGDSAAAQTAIVLAPAAPVDIAPVIMAAYALTQRERELTGLVLQGMSTKQLGAALRISDLTV